MSKLMGAEKVIATDVNEYRMKMAKKFGADFVINATEDVPTKVKEFNNRLADRVIVCTGALSAANQALRSVDRGGTILFFAVPEPGKDVYIPMNNFWRNEITVMTSYGAAPDDLKESLGLISKHKVNVRDMITHRLSLSETGKGFQLVADAKNSIKVIIEPQKQR
jgi:L-iditol 2-dehydrogenase